MQKKIKTQEAMTNLQAEHHDMVQIEGFNSVEDYVLYLIHSQAYQFASVMAANKKVLDYGCNIGYGTNILAEVSKSVIGLDVSQKAIEQAKDLFKRDNLQFQLCDGNSIPFTDSSFDLVVSFQVIEHIVDYQNYLSEINRVLSPGGIAIFTTPNTKIRLEPGMKPWNKFHVREFSGNELKDLLTDYFNSVEIKGLFAESFITDIEITRVKRSLEGYKKISKNPKLYSIIRILRPFAPEFLIKLIRGSKMKSSTNSEPVKSVDDIRQCLNNNSFYYLVENIDNCLDLMAICHK